MRTDGDTFSDFQKKFAKGIDKIGFIGYYDNRTTISC